MSNFTPQYIANTGYKILDQQVVAIAGAAAIVQIPAVTGTNKIQVVADTINRRSFIGNSTLLVGGVEGTPLFQHVRAYDGSTLTDVYIPVMREFLTSQPELYYLSANSGCNVFVTYLAYI